MTCEIDGCDTDQRNGGIMCSAHWAKVPEDLRDEIYAAQRGYWKAKDAYDAVEGSREVSPAHITELAQAANDAYDYWDELRNTAVGEIELQEAEAA